MTAVGCRITILSSANRTFLLNGVIEAVAEEEPVLCSSILSRWANGVNDVSEMKMSLLANRTVFLDDVEVLDALDTWSTREELNFPTALIARSAMMSLQNL